MTPVALAEGSATDVLRTTVVSGGLSDERCKWRLASQRS